MTNQTPPASTTTSIPSARTRSTRSSLSRLALETILVAVVLGAGVGIYSLLVGGFDDLAMKVLASTLAIALAGMVALPCAHARSRGLLGIVPIGGVVLGVVGFGAVAVGVWFETDSDSFWQLFGSMILLSGATAHACLLSLVRLADSHRWAARIAVGAAYSVATLLIYVLWTETDTDGVWRAVGVFGILALAGTALVPVFYRMGGVASPSTPVKYCPGCGCSLPAQLGRVECNRCGGRFLIGAQ